MKIQFIPTEDPNTLLSPVPAVSRLPDWYKKISPFSTGNKPKHQPDGRHNLTVKRCNPFGDAIGAGYFILLENELQVLQGPNGAELTWTRGGRDFVSNHHASQIADDLVPDGYEKTPFKFTNLWGVKTPKNYSTLFTHPINSTNSPFLTLSGIVDTDSYTMPVHFPFFIRRNFEGNILAGTPIVQLLPFKRDAWQSQIDPYDEAILKAEKARFERHLTRPYKKFHWIRKEYK